MDGLKKTFGKAAQAVSEKVGSNAGTLVLEKILGQSISSIGRVPIGILPRKASHYVGFDRFSFLGRISNGTPGC